MANLWRATEKQKETRSCVGGEPFFKLSEQGQIEGTRIRVDV